MKQADIKLNNEEVWEMLKMIVAGRLPEAREYATKRLEEKQEER